MAPKLSRTTFAMIAVLVTAFVIVIRRAGQDAVAPVPTRSMPTLAPETAAPTRTAPLEISHLTEQRLHSLTPSVTQQSPRGEVWLKGELEATILGKRPLALTPAQVKQIAEVYVLFQAVRSEFELSLAEAKPRTSDAVEIVVPPYPEAGATLRRLFHSELERRLGNDEFAKVDDYLGDYFDQMFCEFGTTDQRYRIRPLANATAGTLEIEHELVPHGDLSPTGQITVPRFAGSYAKFIAKPDELEGGRYGLLVPYVAGFRPAQ